METHDREYPRLRYLEAIQDTENGRIILRDPTHLAEGMLVVSEEQFVLLTLLDGRKRAAVQAEFARKYGLLLQREDLDALLEQLDQAGYLAGAGFERYYARKVEEYLRQPYRPLRDPDSFGAPSPQLAEYLDEALGSAAEEARSRASRQAPRSRLAGIVAPHLDFPRGLPCYGDAYHHVRLVDAPKRVVVLGTNHFGRARSVVATDKDFETHWGVVETDRDFLARLQAECGGNLMPYPMDHLHEHSIELHAVWLRHVLGDGFRIVPFLCPDPSGPTGTRAGDPGGVDLREFARALGHLLRQDPEPTLVVASADLSHVGGYFGDDAELTDSFLASVRVEDEAGLAFIDRNDPEGYRKHMARTQNPTRVCSVGCLYALMTALGPDAEPQRIRYHQAVTPEWENAVTCTSYAFFA